MKFKKTTLSFLFLLFMGSVYTVSGQTIFRVTPTGAGSQNGSSWSNAMSGAQLISILRAVPATSAGHEIWVAAGTYKPDLMSRDSTFSISSYVEVYGGFAGTETSRSQRNWVTNQTILSGNIGSLSDSTDNSEHVVTVDYDHTVIDGFTIRDGWADSTASLPMGGGILLRCFGTNASYNNTIISNCIIRNNRAYTIGGAVANVPSIGTGMPLIKDCTFLNNWAKDFGGAIYSGSRYSSWTFFVPAHTNLTVQNSTFIGNDAGQAYGGIFNENGGGTSNATISKCTFRDNNKTAFGNQCFIPISTGTMGSYIVVIDSCRFVHNRASSQPAAIFNADSRCTSGRLTISNTRIDSSYTSLANGSGVSAVLLMTGVYGANVKVNIVNSIFNHNFYGSVGTNTISSWASGTGTDSLFITNSLFYNNSGYSLNALASDNAKHISTITNSTFYNDSVTTYVPGGHNATTVLSSTNNSSYATSPATTESSLFVRNSILWHSLQPGMAPYTQIEIVNDNTASWTSTAAHSAVYNSILTAVGAKTPAWPAAYGTNGGNNWGLKPKFVDTALYDFHLKCGGPGINAGNNGFLPTAINKDVNGATRIQSNIVDMGALETNPSTYTPPKAIPVTTLANKYFTYSNGFNGALDSVVWSFGDGTKAIGPVSGSASHTYAANGTYTVCMHVRDGCGTADSCFTIVLNCPATFTPSFTTTNPSNKTLQITYTGISSSVDSLVWTFGDGQKLKMTSGYTTPFTHTYASAGYYNVCVTLYLKGCGWDNKCTGKNVLGNVGVAPDASLSQVAVYPNPTSDVINIDGAKGTTVTLLNTVGQVVKQAALTSEHSQLNMSTLPNAVYILQMVDVQGNQRKVKVVKQ